MTFSALDSALTGPLTTTAEMRALFDDRAVVAAMLEAEIALARALAGVGLAPAGLAEALIAIDATQFDLGALGEGTALAGVPTIPFVKAVQALLPAELEPFFHLGATTQDIVDTALVLRLKAALDLIARDCSRVGRALAVLAREHRMTACAGRSYGQHAAPVTFGFKAAGWFSGFADALQDFPALRRRVLAVSLGAPVGTTAASGAHGHAVREAMAAGLGRTAPAIAWHTRRARPAQLGAFLAVLLGALAKIAMDVVHLSSTEVGEVAEPHIPGRGGSSAMPHKRNPVSSTVILAAASATKGHVVTLLDSMAAAHERPAGAWHAEWHALPQLLGLTAGALREAIVLAEGLVVDVGRMRRNLDATRGLLFADAAAARLAPHVGRARASELVERAAMKVRDGAGDLSSVLSGDPDVSRHLTRDGISEIFDLQSSTTAAARSVDRVLAIAPSLDELLVPPS